MPKRIEKMIVLQLQVEQSGEFNDIVTRLRNCFIKDLALHCVRTLFAARGLFLVKSTLMHGRGVP